MVKDLGSDFRHLPSMENLFWAGVGGGLALAVHPVDDNVNHAMVNSDFAHNFFKLGKYLGNSYTLLPAAVTVYVIGRAKDRPKVSHMGMDLIQSLAVSEALVQTLKYTTRRERPDGSGRIRFHQDTRQTRLPLRPPSNDTWDGRAPSPPTSSPPTSQSHDSPTIGTG